jgi:hypothetical protein
MNAFFKKAFNSSFGNIFKLFENWKKLPERKDEKATSNAIKLEKLLSKVAHKNLK